jgi:hypothetical protein
MELFDAEGEAVEAFTQAEVDAKVKEAGTDTSSKVKEAEDALKAKIAEYDKLDALHESKKTSYKELQDKKKDDDKTYKEVLDRDTNAYNKTVEDKIKEIAGEDKEYAAELKKQLDEGVGSETTDADAIGKQIAKAQALTNIELSREVNSPVGGGGGAPDSPDGSGPRFTDTTEGKDTFDVFNEMRGNPAEEETK